MRKTSRLAAVLLGLALAASACGGDGGGTTDGAADQPTTGTDTADLSGQSVEVAAVWTGTEQENFQTVLDAFAEETGAKVTYTSTGDDIATVLGTRIQGGDPPDVAMLPQPGLLSSFAADDALVPVSDEVEAAVDENYAPVWKELGSVDDTLYGVWFKAANKSTVWYRTDAFEQAGVEPPTTWEELLQVAQTISDSGVTPVSIAGADGWTLTDWFENVYLRVAGPEKYDQLANHEIPWTDQSVKDTLAVLAELWGDEDLVVGGASGALQTDFPTSVTQVFADDPQGAIVYEGDFVAGVIAGETSASVGEAALFFDFPSVNDSPTSVVGGGDVAVALSDSEGAQALLAWMATPQAAEVWAGLGGFTSPNLNLDTATYPDDVTRASAEALVEAADAFRFDMSDLAPAEFGGTPGAGEWKILQDFLKNPSDIDGTAQALEKAAARAFG